MCGWPVTATRCRLQSATVFTHWPGVGYILVGFPGNDVDHGVRKIMQTIQIDLPDVVFLALKETPEQLSREIRMAAAAKLYELGKLSSGRAAEMAGVSRVSFLQLLAQYDVSVFDMKEEELQRDLGNA